MARIRADFMSGVRSGVNGTPSFFINGEKYEGGYDVQAMTEAIEETLVQRSGQSAGNDAQSTPFPHAPSTGSVRAPVVEQRTVPGSADDGLEAVAPFARGGHSRIEDGCPRRHRTCSAEGRELLAGRGPHRAGGVAIMDVAPTDDRRAQQRLERLQHPEESINRAARRVGVGLVDCHG